MSTAVAPLVEQVAERARTEPGFADVLDAILGAPTTPQGTLERVAAHSLNEERRSALVREFVEGSLATPKVQKRLALRPPPGVHRPRRRGERLGERGRVSERPLPLRPGGRDIPNTLCRKHSGRRVPGALPPDGSGDSC